MAIDGRFKYVFLKDEKFSLQTMNLEPKLLTDRSRLKEIYKLRVRSWELSDKGGIINQHLFPDGWHDELDPTAQHWVITNERDEIIASARLNIFNRLEDYPYGALASNLDIHKCAPFGFYGRLVIHPQYQGLNLSAKLITSREHYCETIDLRWRQALVTNERIKNILSRFNFEYKGQIKVNYHKFTEPHLVDVLVKECPCNR